MNEYELLGKVIPEGVKKASSQEIARVVTGVNEFTLEKIGAYLGQKIAERHNKWRPVANGLLAYEELTSGE